MMAANCTEARADEDESVLVVDTTSERIARSVHSTSPDD